MKKLVKKLISEVLKYKNEIAIAAFISSILIVGVMMTKPKAPVEEAVPQVIEEVVEVEVVETVDSLEIKDDK